MGSAVYTSNQSCTSVTMLAGSYCIRYKAFRATHTHTHLLIEQSLSPEKAAGTRTTAIIKRARLTTQADANSETRARKVAASIMAGREQREQRVSGMYADAQTPEISQPTQPARP